ncbi:MAG: hypothetical protein ACPG52_04130 [Cognaticolwellia sp.]
MFFKYLKSVLVFNRAQNKAPNFVLVYLLISLIWHHEFFISLILNNGTFADKFTTAMSDNSHQYFAVLVVTSLFFLMRLSYLYFANKADMFIEEDEPIEDKIGRDQLFAENKDVARLLAHLEETKAKLSQVREREAQAQADKTATISKMLAVQAELELAQADITMLRKANQDLTAHLHSCETT